jgi:hypothetical protein
VLFIKEMSRQIKKSTNYLKAYGSTSEPKDDYNINLHIKEINYWRVLISKPV